MYTYNCRGGGLRALVPAPAPAAPPPPAPNVGRRSAGESRQEAGRDGIL